jgi:hypothetical protein
MLRHRQLQPPQLWFAGGVLCWLCICHNSVADMHRLLGGEYVVCRVLVRSAGGGDLVRSKVLVSAAGSV